MTIIGVGLGWGAYNYGLLSSTEAIAVSVVASIIFLWLLAKSVGRYVTEPVKALSQAIMHVAPGQHSSLAPNLDKLRVGRELVTNLSLQVYELASHSLDIKPVQPSGHADKAQAILEELPMPLLVCDKNQNITFANSSASHFLELDLSNIVGHNLYSVLDLSFSDDETLDEWLAQSRQNTVTASRQWDRVRVNLESQKKRKQCDLCVYYNKNNPTGAETVLALFDKTKFYGMDDDAIGFIALAVHELRTPLTILRGYIEVFEDEVADQLDPEMQDFMEKMQASAQQLSSFVSNILNVARVEENQLFLQLQSEDWGQVLTSFIEDIELRAKIHGKKITCEIQPDMPAVAIDRTSMYEVINNLLENAIKYSDDSPDIIVKTFKRDDGQVETTIQDFGIGIPTSIIGNLFEKFYRNHRSRTQFGGTGLGLYLSKAIITAHGGQIWVQSKEDQGSTFGFTLQPYTQLAKKEGSHDNRGIVRTAHGWIKNHSFYKR